MSKKYWALLGTLLFGAIAGAVLVSTSSQDGPGVTVRNFNRTAAGMSVAEVTGIFGVEPQEIPSPVGFKQQTRLFIWQRADGSATAFVDFDENGRATHRGWQSHTFADKLRLMLSTF